MAFLQVSLAEALHLPTILFARLDREDSGRQDPEDRRIPEGPDGRGKEGVAGEDTSFELGRIKPSRGTSAHQGRGDPI